MRKMGVIGMGTFLCEVVGRSAVSIIPNNLRTFIYSKVLRKKD
jgi:hypothetical protein